MAAWIAPLNAPITSWRGRRVWVVGASSGIGRATAALLHQRGASVVLSARSGEALREFTAQHPGAVALPLDVCDAAQVRAGVETLLQSGPVDLVFYCAGTYQPQRATAFDLAQMRKHMEVNYHGALHVLDAMLPALLARGGHLSLAASVAGYRALPNALAYGPTKAALIQLAETLHMDLRDEGVGVSVVNPGFVETPLTAQNEFRMPGLMTAGQAAAHIVRGWERGRFEIHFPRRFTLGLKLLRQLPFRLYSGLVRRGTGL
ncbi:SDR family NAD(P)-dependent oxidoreductase [Caenimonas sedimenti]|uniref:SDR family NAD(P)-dependent oxidoreductase n=1 Tax=Caenimonas sedimenti TaxID=2596921 RepID=A0A562ZFZ1_9BURK|nr:SDR family NAD(P)-dependent oxidoreductase [Caenimonas sedimenti]TWO66631.1 SDR family NAD(P)-dependent oxidoreductase [Caenimonas sedimenti]